MSEEQPSGFRIYECKDCQEITADPVAHTSETKHLKGYYVKDVLFEVRETPHQKKTKKQNMQMAAEKILAEQGI